MTIDLKTGKPFPRGARPTPRHKLLRAVPHVPTLAPPPQFAIVPKQISIWGNSTHGDCVSAEEAFAKAAWSTMCGFPETFIPDDVVVSWASAHGFLEGADLSEVMDAMAKGGFTVGGTTYGDGSHAGVDYSDEAVLQSALCTGPVKIAIDADALPSGAGNAQGWYSVSTGHFGSTDHCVGLSGFGTADYLYGQLNVPLPSGLPGSTPGYLLFTWSTIGFVTHGWLMGTCTEAWVRSPTTPGQQPVLPIDWYSQI